MICSADGTVAFDAKVSFATAAFEEWSADTHSGYENSALVGEFGQMALCMSARLQWQARTLSTTDFSKSCSRYKSHKLVTVVALAFLVLPD